MNDDSARRFGELVGCQRESGESLADYIYRIRAVVRQPHAGTADHLESVVRCHAHRIMRAYDAVVRRAGHGEIAVLVYVAWWRWCFARGKGAMVDALASACDRHLPAAVVVAMWSVQPTLRWWRKKR